MQRVGILTAGGDTPALNATIFGAVERANQLGIEVYGIVKGFGGLLDPRVPYVPLNPLFSSIPELDPCQGGTILGASRTYISADSVDEMKTVAQRLEKLGIEGLICIGGDGTINGMQPISEQFPCVLAPKTIDNDLGLNYIEEPNVWERSEDPETGKPVYSKSDDQAEIELGEIVNYATPGYATAVYVVAQSINRIRTTAESHRRIGIVEVMGRESGYIALGSAYGQPDIILIPEVAVDFERLATRVAELYDLQKHVVIVVGEGVKGAEGVPLGDLGRRDPSGNVRFDGAAEALKSMLIERLGDGFFQSRRRHDTAESAIFTRMVGHTQRGGRPIQFDRFHAAQLGGHAMELLVRGENNALAVLQYNQDDGFHLMALPANKLRDRWGAIHPRNLHTSFYDCRRLQPSKLGREFLMPIFTTAIGADDVEHIRADLFAPGNLSTRYQGFNIDVHKRMRYLTHE